MNTTIEEVQRFLDDLHAKLLFTDLIFFDSRQKNVQTLASLNIAPNLRLSIINNLSFEDFSEGPIADKMIQTPEMWVFGKYLKSKEIYIKLTLGIFNECPTCISFHVAEHPMNYPFKS